MAVRLWPGTSGFSYPQWKGPFYPEAIKDRDMLTFYGERLPAVEINNTFYRMPRAKTLEGWVSKVPDEFRFVLKAPQRITHKERLRESQSSVDYFWQNARVLAGRMGPVLFQLPPFLKVDVERLQAFLAILPEQMRAVFEFRHASWDDARVADLLAEKGCALCVADTDDGDDPMVMATCDFGYLRLRRASYSDESLARWVERIRDQPWNEVFVFFKHEDEGAAPALAARMRAAFEAAEQAGSPAWQ